MRVAIIHLSDIHFRDGARPRPVVAKREGISKAAITYIPEGCDAIFLVISGDISFSGTVQQYEIAREFIGQIQAEVQTRLRKSVQVLIVPGNHDLDHQVEPPGARNLVVDNIDLTKIDTSIVNLCTKPQQSYREFAQLFLPKVVSGPLGLVDDFKLSIGTETIVVRLVNSAWMSTQHEGQGKLKLPTESIERNELTDHAKLVVVVLHHPLNWFEANNARQILRAFEASADVVMTGHEHETGASKRERPTGIATDWIEGGVLQENDPNNSSFNLLLIDTAESYFQVWMFEWFKDHGLYKPRDVEPPRMLFRRNVGRLKNTFTLDPAFESKLAESLDYVHPTGSRPRLEDIFVYPDLRELPLGSTKPRTTPIVDPLAYFVREERVLITGLSQSGKTSLARSFFRDLRERGIVPVLLSGSDIKASAKDKLREVIRKAFVEQYRNTDPETFLQADLQKKAVIVDDWHTCNLNRASQGSALQVLSDQFSMIALVADEQVNFEELSQHTDTAASILLDFKRCEILPLGHRKRDELVERWYNLGRTHNDDEVVLAQRAARATQAVSSALGKGLPCYPPWLLIWLQGMDAHATDPRHVGSQGYLYEALVTMSLRTAARGRIQDDVLLNYFSELANEIYGSNTPLMSKGRHTVWHHAFNKKYALAVDLVQILGIAEKAGILFRLPDDSIRFKFRGLLYFFVARYIADRLRFEKESVRESVRERVREFARSVHREDCCGILNSLTFLTKDPFVIDVLLSQARAILTDVQDCNVVTDTKFLRNLGEEVPKLVVERFDVQENRRALLARRDEEEAQEQESDTDLERQPDDPIFILISAMKMIEVLGQVLRNLSGSIEADKKVEIAGECVSLGLRLLRFVLEGIERDREGLAVLVFEIMRRHRVSTDPRVISNETKIIISNLGDAVGFSVVRHISAAVGHESLARVFELLVNQKKMVSYRIVSFSIELDHYHAFPFGALAKLKAQVERKSPYAMHLLRSLVWQHVYVFPMAQLQVKKVCEAAGLSVKEMAFVKYYRDE